MARTLSRRDLLKATAVAGLGYSLSSPAARGEKADRGPSVRVGFIGVGRRGTGLLQTMLGLGGVVVPAVCDTDDEATRRATHIVEEAGGAPPERYAQGDYAYESLLGRGDLDAVIIATPWQWHAPMAVDAMEQGIYPAVEVPAALSLDECWSLVDTSERTGVPCMMLENWCFRRDNLALLNMTRQGLFGQIVHCHCAYSHDCVDHWYFDAETGAPGWGAEFLLKYNRNQYPTHALGPVMSWMDINCGDRFASVTSTASASLGINDYFRRRFGPDAPAANLEYRQGDIVTTLIQTEKGKTICLNFDMQLPRPYDNRWLLQGTRGVYSEERASLYLTGRSPQYHQWEPFAPYQDQFEHTWWTEGALGGHGGTDGLELKLFLEAVRTKGPTPIDVYDSVAMSCLVPLSGDSIAQGGAPVSVPDFTRGRWETKTPTFAVDGT